MNKKEIKEFWRKSEHDLVFTQATALSYTTLISMVPLLAVAFFLFKSFGGFDIVIKDLGPIIENNLAPSFSDKISVYLDEIINKFNAGAIGIVGAIGFIVTTITTLTTIEKTFNVIWGVRKPRRLGKRITTYWTLMTIGPLLLGVSFMFSAKALAWLKTDPGFLASVAVLVFTVVPYFTSGLLFSALFLFIPNLYVHYKDALKAGMITGVVFELAKLIYAIYAKQTISKDALYGALIVVPVFLIWIYVVWLIVLFGAELCCYFQFKRLKLNYKFNWEERLSSFAIADILETLSSTDGGLTPEEMQSKLQIPFYELTAHLHFLEQQGQLIHAKRRYYRTHPHSAIDMDQIATQLDTHRYVPKGNLGQQIYAKTKSLWKVNP